MPTSLDDLAAAARSVTATSSRKEKTELLAQLLRRLGHDEIVPAVGILLAKPKQNPIGVGWAMVYKILDSLNPGPQPKRSPTVVEFDYLLDELKAQHGDGSESRRRELLESFLKQCTQSSVELVAKTLTGEARTGALNGVMSEAGAKAATVKTTSMRRAVMLQGDLAQTIALAISGGESALSAIDLIPGRPIAPMLASTASGIEQAMSINELAVVEWKLDGARIQVHGCGDGSVRVFTRNLNDITERLPAVVELVAGLDCETIVLDGEIIYSAGDHQPIEGSDPFQEIMSVITTQEQSAKHHQLTPYFFDLMYLDGQSLIDMPLRQRREMLVEAVGDKHCIPGLVTSSLIEAESVLQEALSAGHEGVMVKSADSDYQAGRRQKSWLKIKPVHTFDLLVLAAEWGYGRRQGWLSNLHLGVRDPKTGAAVMVGKTFKGLTDETLKWQTETFLELKDPGRSSASTVYLKSPLVAEIAVDGIQTSNRYPGGIALRFARLRRYRPDKTAETASTVDDLKQLLTGKE